MFFSPIHKGKLEEEIWISALAWSLCPPSPNSYVEPLISDKLVSRDDNFGTYTVIWVEPSWMEIVSYRKRCQRAQIFSLCFLLCGDTRRNCLQSRKRALTRHQICWCLDLKLPRTVRNTFLLFKPHNLW